MATNDKKAAAPLALTERTVLKVNDFRSVLTGKAMMDQLAAALPTHLKHAVVRYARSVVTEMQRNWQLTKCTSMSVLGCMMQAAQLGLEIGGPLGQAYMVPYGNKRLGQDEEDPRYPKKEATFQIGYRGLLQLAHRSDKIKTAFSHCVYTKDTFKIILGSEPKLIHEPFTADPDRGPMIGVYAVVTFVNGGKDFEYMSKNEIDKHRKQYSKAKDSPWDTAYEEMAKKTPLRRLMKRCPLATEAQSAAVLDEYGEAGVQQHMASLVRADNLVTAPVGETSTKAAALEERLDLDDPQFDFGEGQYDEEPEPVPVTHQRDAEQKPVKAAEAEAKPSETPPADDEPPIYSDDPPKSGLFSDGGKPAATPTTDAPRTPRGRR